jgi:hypothetical protein
MLPTPPPELVHSDARYSFTPLISTKSVACELHDDDEAFDDSVIFMPSGARILIGFAMSYTIELPVACAHWTFVPSEGNTVPANS